VDDRTPVVVGVGQLLAREDHPDRSKEPAALMAEALELAAADAGAGRRVLDAATGLWTVATISWRYENPAAAVAELLAVEPRHLATSSVGGDGPQILADRAARAVAAGHHDLVLITGAEATRSRRVAKRLDARLSWTGPWPGRPDGVTVDADPVHPEERVIGLNQPVHYYPLFENALRGSIGRTIGDHQAALGALWARFAAVSRDNPYAWRPLAVEGPEIVTPADGNRMVSFPYTKLMTANPDVNMAAAFIICSVTTARSLGVPADRWVFPLAGVDSHEHWFVSERQNLHESPAIKANARMAFSLAGVGIDDIAHVDLYSCFPSAVEVAAQALGFPLDDPNRPPTQTGGLTFAGGPGNNYSSHALAALAGRLREDAGSIGLLTANGWFLTKHALGLYSTTPPRKGYRGLSTQEDVDRQPRRAVARDHSGSVALETYTVVHGPDGLPDTALVAGLSEDGRRVWASSTDLALIAILERGEMQGQSGYVHNHVFELEHH
jgi:acetyl-CoA C-acetyltransferase